MIKVILFATLLFYGVARAQTIDEIYVNLYTDSLKKGTYNYINIDGRLSNGSYLPLDSSHIIFKSSAGKFYGNSLLIDKDYNGDKVTINVTSRKNSLLRKEFDIYVKKKPDDERLKTEDELINEMKHQQKRKMN